MHCTFRFVVYLGSFFVLWISMNQSFQSPHPEVGICTIVLRSNCWYLYKISSRIICRHVVDMSGFLYRYVTWKKKKILTIALTLSTPILLFQLAVGTAVLCYIRPKWPVRGIWMCTFTIWFNEGNWFLYLNCTRIILTIDCSRQLSRSCMSVRHWP